MKATVVNFLYNVDEDDLFAFFPYEHERHNRYLCYSHTGQHSTCDLGYARICKSATKKQYTSLLNELKSIGYTVDVQPFSLF